MVQGLAEFNRRWSKVPEDVRKAARLALEKGATELVAEMNRNTPIPEIIVDWTWGKPPAGAMTLGSRRTSSGGDELAITIFAIAHTEDYPTGHGGVPGWFEFGTAQRAHKSGRRTGAITASPFFWPIWRLRRRRVRSRMTRQVNQALKRL
ncbi:MAG: HK97 gp10 family phage protein [Rhodobacteraceae bacterium]|nr:HK97 gp10 family phage protein [Paracoccaceae bacterium]MBR9820720.1 HK97 gp10 family phage protein [Paracoccaceae bacterium]